MSERRTAEIKFRCTPSFKASLQTAADAAGESLTEYIENAVRAQQNVNNVVVGLIARRAADPKGLPGFTSTNIAEDGPLTFEVQDSGAPRFTHPNFQPADTPADDVAPPPLRPNTCGCKPWAFCYCKAGA